MIEKESDIKIVRQIHFKLEPTLIHDLHAATRVEAFVLIATTFISALTTAILHEQTLAWNVESRQNLGFSSDAIFDFALKGVVFGAMKEPRDRITRHAIDIAIPIDNHRKLRDVLLIEAKARNPLLSSPFRDMTHAVVEAIAEHFVTLTAFAHASAKFVSGLDSTTETRR